jgi:hypothetical protein
MTKAASTPSISRIDALGALSLTAIAGVIFIANVSHADDDWRLTGNHPPAVESQRQLGAADGHQLLHLQIRFALRHRDKLETLLAEQQDHGSSNYHKWIATGAFLKRFGASPAEINAVSDWLAGEGFSVTRSAPNFLDFTGPVAQAERTFAVRIAKFGDGSRYANTVDPIVPKRFAGVIGCDSRPRQYGRGRHAEASTAGAVASRSGKIYTYRVASAAGLRSERGRRRSSAGTETGRCRDNGIYSGRFLQLLR